VTTYQVALVQLRLNNAEYPRPCVAITVSNSEGVFGALAISSKMDLFRSDQHFLIRDDHPDFSATGLKTNSYVIGSPVFNVRPERFIRTLGELRGDLAKEFEKWIGE
jgi:hypothetical protein